MMPLLMQSRRRRPFIGGAGPSPLLTDLVSYYKLDEASGNALDAHGAFTLTETSGTIGTATGIINGGRDFEAGDTEYAENATQANFGDTDFTFSIWVKFESIASFPVIFRKRYNANAQNTIGLYYDTGTNRLSFDLYSGATTGTVSWGSALSTGTWYHVRCWHDSVNNLIGISVNNGTPVTASYSLGIPASTGSFQLGGSSHQAIYFDGVADEFGIWNRMLTTDEGTDLYNSGAGLAYPFS